MTVQEQNDLFYVCSLIEYIARKTNNKRKVIVDVIGTDGISKQLYDAEVNYCLSSYSIQFFYLYHAKYLIFFSVYQY